jgi:hypothetical protein
MRAAPADPQGSQCRTDQAVLRAPAVGWSPVFTRLAAGT